MTLPVGRIIPKVDIDTRIPSAINQCEVMTYIDVSHDTSLISEISVGQFDVTLFGASVYYKRKIQATVSTSSGEAEFMAAVSGAKSAKYISYILEDLGFSRQVPTKYSVTTLEKQLWQTPRNQKRGPDKLM